MSIKFKSKAALGLAKSFPKTVKRFHSTEDGATAVEFAMIAFPFFLLIFAIIETSLFFFAGQYLETAVDDTMRLYRTGQLGNGTTAEDFRDELCDRVVVMFECKEIKTSVQTALEFDELGDPPVSDDEGNLPDDEYPPNSAFGGEVIMQISASYKWPVFTNFAAPLAYKNGENFALIQVTAVTQTEPF